MAAEQATLPVCFVLSPSSGERRGVFTEPSLCPRLTFPRSMFPWVSPGQVGSPASRASPPLGPLCPFASLGCGRHVSAPSAPVQPILEICREPVLSATHCPRHPCRAQPSLSLPSEGSGGQCACSVHHLELGCADHRPVFQREPLCSQLGKAAEGVDLL